MNRPPINTREAVATDQGARVTDLWCRFKQDGCDRSRDSLFLHYTPLVQRAAKRVARSLPAYVVVDDLVSAGSLGLIDAMDSYDLEKGVRFETFCYHRVRGAIIDELRASDWVPRTVRRQSRGLHSAVSHLSTTLSRPPSDDEVAEHLGLDESDYARVAKHSAPAQIYSMDTPSSRAQGLCESWSQTVRDPNRPTPVAEVLRAELGQVIAKHLNRTERLVVTLYYYEQLTMKQIASTLNITESRVSQIHSAVLKRLRDHLADEPSEGDRAGAFDGKDDRFDLGGYACVIAAA